MFAFVSSAIVLFNHLPGVDVVFAADCLKSFLLNVISVLVTKNAECQVRQTLSSVSEGHVFQQFHE